MIVSSLTLSNFRNYAKRRFVFSRETTLIVGPNTAGKTNILEAIFLCATGKSFRAEEDSELISWNEDISRIEVSDSSRLELVITRGILSGLRVPKKRYIINGVPKQMRGFVGNLRVVLFWPEDLILITDSPSRRRKYLDSVLIQTDREYLRSLRSYERGLRQRNRVLEFLSLGKAQRSQLIFWDQLLIKEGSYITEKREKYINFVNICSLPLSLYQIEYDKSIISKQRLIQYEKEEVAAETTLVGPHRDDIIFKVKSPAQGGQAKIKSPERYLDLSKFGSRGEQRLAVLWLKMAELDYIKEKAGDRPVLLLDDIFSELDEEHRRMVAGIVGKQQTILTTTDKDIQKEIRFTNAKVIEL